MFTPRERLILTLQKKAVDRPPCICPGGMMNMVVEEVMDLSGSSWPEAHTNPELMAELAAAVYYNGGFENFGVPFCMTVEAEVFGARVDLGTKINEPRVTGYPLNTVSDWTELPLINLNRGRLNTVIDAIKILKEKTADVPVIGNLTGPVSLASSLVEPMVFYKELRTKNKAAHEFMAFIAENLITFGKAQLYAGADVLAIADPSGTGEILGPKMFREFAVPYLNLLLDGVKESVRGGTIVHICGQLRSIYQELNAIRCDAISFDSITSVKQMVGNVTGKAIMGNVSTFALEKSTPENIRMIAGNCLKDGVDILSPACGIGPRTP